MLKLIKRLLQGAGVESDQIDDLAEELTELIGDETKPKGDEKPPKIDEEKLAKKIAETIAKSTPAEQKPLSEDDKDAELETLKASHLKELEEIKLKNAIDIELAKLSIKDGYADVVSKLIDFDKVKFNDKGELVGLKEQTDVLSKDKAELFGGRQGYNPAGGKEPPVETDITKAMKQKDFNFTKFAENLQRSEQ